MVKRRSAPRPEDPDGPYKPVLAPAKTMYMSACVKDHIERMADGQERYQGPMFQCPICQVKYSQCNYNFQITWRAACHFHMMDMHNVLLDDGTGPTQGTGG